MTVDVKGQFNLIGVTVTEYEIDGRKINGYKAKLDQPDGVYNIKINEEAYKSLKDLNPMTPVVCTCRVATHADKEADRFKVIGAVPVKAAASK